MHFQNDCEYMVNNVNIQYEIPITKIKWIFKSSTLFNKVLTAEKNKTVCILTQIVTTLQISKCVLSEIVSLSISKVIKTECFLH